MDYPILEVIENSTVEEFFESLKKYGKCTDFLEQNIKNSGKKDEIFVGSVCVVYKPKFNKQDDKSQCVVVLKISSLIKGPHEHKIFRVVFIGRVVKDIIHLRKGDLIAILNPKLFFVMSSDTKLPSFTVGPCNVVVWVCRTKKMNKLVEKDANNEDVTDQSESSDENESSSFSASLAKNNRVYRTVPVNLKEINNTNPQNTLPLSHQSNQSHSLINNVKSFSKSSRVNNVRNSFPSQNTAVDGSIRNPNNPTNSIAVSYSAEPECSKKDHSSRFSVCKMNKTMNSKCHNHFYNSCSGGPSKCEQNVSCCSRGPCRKINSCHAKPSLPPSCHHSLHCGNANWVNHCVHSNHNSCFCNYRGRSNCGCGQDGDSHDQQRAHFSRDHWENPSPPFSKELSKNSIGNRTCCCRFLRCPCLMSHCCWSAHQLPSSPHKSCCNLQKSICLPENTCHAVTSKCCCNCSFRNVNPNWRDEPFGTQNIAVNEAQVALDATNRSLYKESIFRTQDWVRQWQSPNIDIPASSEPSCIEISSSSSSNASSHLLQAQNIIKPAFSFTNLNIKATECSLNTESQTSKVVKEKKKLFNPFDNSSIIAERSPETIIEESTPFSSEDPPQNPLGQKKLVSKVTIAENQISTTTCGNNDDEIPVRDQFQNTTIQLNQNFKKTNVGESCSQDNESLTTRKNDNEKSESNFSHNVKDLRKETQEVDGCSTTEENAVVANTSFPDLRLKNTQERQCSANSVTDSQNNPNSNKNCETNQNIYFSVASKGTDNNEITIISDRESCSSSVINEEPLKKRKDVPSNSEKDSDDIALLSERRLRKPKRMKKSVGGDGLENKSPVSDKSNETIDLDQENLNSSPEERNPEKQSKTQETPKFGDSVTRLSLPSSSGQSFYDALSTQSSKPSSQERWIIKPITEATEYLNTAEKLYELKATPRRNVRPINLKLYETFSVKGVIINMVPNLENSFSIIKGFCHSGCKQSYKYDEFSFLDEIIHENCTSCRYRIHFACPRCHEAGLFHPLCLFYSFEIHLLVGDCVLRIEIDHQDGVDFIGCTPATYVRCSSKISQKIKRIITASPPKSKDSVVLLSATLRPKSKMGYTVLGIHKTFLSKHLTMKGAVYNYVPNK